MAHEIDTSLGRPAFAYTGAKPWWERDDFAGKKVDKHMTTAEAITQAGLDWDVYKNPVKTTITREYVDELGCPRSESRDIIVPDHFVTGRADTGKPFGVVGSRYQVIQNRDAFSFFDSALGDGSAHIECAGALFGGSRIFACAKLPEITDIKPGDPVGLYLMLTAAHDGTGVVEAHITPVRAVCWNTVRASIAQSQDKVKVRHTKNAKSNLQKAHEVLYTAKDYFARVTEQFKAMAKREMIKAEVDAFIASLFPATDENDVPKKTQNLRDAVLTNFENGIGHELSGHTAWGMFNAVTQYIDHDRVSRVEGAESNFEASHFVTQVGNLRQAAFNLLNPV